MADASWSGFTGTLGTDITSSNAMKWASYSDWTYKHWLIIEDTSYPYLGTQENDFTGVSGSNGTDITTTNAKLEASYTGWDFSTIWSIYDTYTYPFIYNAPLILSDDYIHKKYKGKGVRGTIVSDTSQSYTIFKNVTLDLSAYDDGVGTTSTEDYIGFSFYLSNSTIFSATPIGTLTFETSTNNYFYSDLNITTTTGWNVISLLKNDFIEVGSPNWSNITKMYLKYDVASGNSNEYITMGIISLLKQESSSGGSVLPQALDTTDSPTFGTTTLTDLTEDRIVITDENKTLSSSVVTSAELTYLSGQDQYLSSSSTPVFKDIEVNNERVITTSDYPSTVRCGVFEDFGNVGTWDEINTRITSVTSIRSIEKITDNIILADGSGRIIRSTDGGWTWRNMGTLMNAIYDIIHIGNGIIIAIGYSSSGDDVYKSTDYGLTWTTKGTIGTVGSLTCDYFGNGIFVAGDFNGNLFRSTDYGETWSDLGKQYSASSIQKIIYIGDGIGLASTGGNRYILRTTDYGATWSNLGALTGTSTVYSFAYASNGIVLAGTGTSGHLYRSTDYGLTWTNLGLISDANTIACSTFIGNGVGFIGFNHTGSSAGGLYKTNDYGATWSEVGDFGTSYVYSIELIGNGTLLIGTSSTGLMYRATMGINTQSSTENLTLKSLQTYKAKRNTQEILDITENKTINKTGLIESKGQSWVSCGGYGTETQIWKIKHLGNGVCLATTGWTEKILRSADYGNTWDLVYQHPTAGLFYGLEYCGNGICLAGLRVSGLDVQIYRSVDYGFTWAYVDAFVSDTIVYDILHIGSGIVLAGTFNDADIYRSTNYGATWTSASCPSTGTSIYNLTNCGNGIILAGSDVGEVLRSWNYGASGTWEFATKPNLTNNVRVIEYIGNGIVLCVLDNEELYKSTNYGTDWELISVLSTDFNILYVRSLLYVGDGVVVMGASEKPSGSTYSIYQSSDYGETWTSFYTSANAYHVQCLEYLGNGIILGGTLGSTSSPNPDLIIKSTIDYNVYQKFIEKTDNLQYNSLILGETPVNLASTPISDEHMIIIQQGTEPTYSDVNQIGIFATSGDSCTLGLITEATPVSESLTPNYSFTVKLNGVSYKIPLELIP